MDTYQFSQLYPASCVAFSPGSTFLATAVEDRVVVRSTATLDVIRSWTCTLPDPAPSRAIIIHNLQWSSSGARLLAHSVTSGASWVYDLAHDDAVARLSGDITHVEWGIDEVAASSERGLALYDLSSNSPKFIQNAHVHTWSPDRRYLAVAERHHSKEHIGIYDKEGLHFPVDMTETGGLSWSPCGRWLALWEKHFSSSMKFYSPVGAHVGDARDLHEDITLVVWSPTGRHVGVGGSEGRVTLLEAESWQPVLVLDQLASSSSRVWVEPPSGVKLEGITQFIPGEAPSSRSPITSLGFSPDGRIIYYGAESYLHVTELGVDDAVSTPRVASQTTVLFNSPIKGVEICPTADRIAAVTRDRSLYLWDGLGVEGVKIPANSDFHGTSLHWAPDGHSIAIRGKSTFCLVYEELPEERDSAWEGEEE